MIAPLVLTLALAAEVPLTGSAVAELVGVDRAMTAFVEQHQVPGMALAIAREGKVLYARGFGYSDRTKQTPVQPDDRFRIASVSKPLTGVAIIKLVEMGKLELDRSVFAFLGLEIPADGDERLKRVTIRHLLHHLGGWDRGKSFDPMFRPRVIAMEQGVDAPAGPDAIIRYMLKRPLDHDPGTHYAYSNFGYCVLGRVIEKASGMGYEAFVRQHVLEPGGAKQLQIGRSRLADRLPGEVRYYPSRDAQVPSVFPGEKLVPLPYGGWYLEAMDAHGGWIASAPDLVRFTLALNRPAKPVLAPKSIELLFQKPTQWPGLSTKKSDDPAYYACGWLVRPRADGKLTIWHNGKLDGTATLLAHRADGITFAVLFNGDAGADNQYLGALIEKPLHTALNEIQQWP